MHFSPRISGDAWNELVNDPDRPMQNRAIQNSYSPGSIFKLIMAEAGLEEGSLEDNPAVICRGSAVYYGRVFHCHDKKGHGAIHLEQAIAKSCNIFFYELGRRLGISKIAEHAQALGLGERTGIDLPGERSGVMPSPEWKMTGSPREMVCGRDHFRFHWAGSRQHNAAADSPGGERHRHRRVAHDSACAAAGGEVPGSELEVAGASHLDIGEEHARRIREGMWESVNNWGTGHNAAIPGLDICGKTGTVQVIGKENKQLDAGGYRGSFLVCRVWQQG